MSDATYAVAMDCEHATIPDVLWDVQVPSELEQSTPRLWVPPLETWTLDTLRMVLHELAAFLPPDPNAHVTIVAKTDRPKGRARADGTRRAPRFNNRVEFSVTARGWTVSVRTDQNQAPDGQRDWATVKWTAPMQAVLLDLAAKSPLKLAAVRPVDCADPGDVGEHGIRFSSRRDVVNSRDARPAAKIPETRAQRVKRVVREILDEGGAQ